VHRGRRVEPARGDGDREDALRGRARIATALDRVEGVGPARRAALLKAFGSVAALAQASAEEIARRASVPASVAERVRAELAARSEAGPTRGAQEARKARGAQGARDEHETHDVPDARRAGGGGRR